MDQYKNVINKAVDYVARNLEGNEDLYALAISSYALQMANHNSKDYILQTFDARAMRKGSREQERQRHKISEKNLQFILLATVNWCGSI